MIKESYNKLRKQYELPDFDKLNNEFEISSIEHEDFLLRAIRRKMVEKLVFFIDILEGAVAPTESTIHMYESNFFTDEDRKKAFSLFKKLMYFEQLSAEVAAHADDKKDAAFISECFAGWLELKSDVGAVVAKLKDSWRKKVEIKTGEKYFI